MATRRIKPRPVRTREEALEIIDSIARAQIALRAKGAEYAERMLELQETVGREVDVMKEAIAALVARVAPYIERNGPAELFAPGRREGETALARFGVRLGNPTVVKDRRWTWDALAEGDAWGELPVGTLRLVVQILSAELRRLRRPAR